MLPLFMEYISYSITLILLVGVVIGAIGRQNLDAPMKYLHGYLVFALLSDVAFRALGNLGYNLFAIPIYAFLELLILSFFFYKYLLKGRSLVLYVLGIAITGLLIDGLFFSQLFSVSGYQSLGKVIEDFMLVFLSLNYYFLWIKGQVKESSWLLLNGMMLVYFLINLILFASINFLVNEVTDLIIWFWAINNIVTVIYYSFIAYYLWQHGKTRPHLQRG